MGDDTRMPQNLQSLLRFCMNAGDNPDVSSVEMDEEKQKWLADALNGMTMDVAKRLRQLIRSLLDYMAAGADTRKEKEADAVETLEELTDWIDDIDLAIDFMKIGGFDLLPALLDIENDLSPSVRALAAALVGSLVQNNPPCQAFLTAHMPHVFQQLLKMVDMTVETENVRLRALFAVSSCVRQHRPGLDLFIERQGFEVLLRVLQSRCPSLQTKAAFLLFSLTSESPEFDDALDKLGVASILSSLLSSPHLAWHEHLLATLRTLAQRHSGLRAQFEADPELPRQLESRLTLLKGAPEHEESLEAADELFRFFRWPESMSEEGKPHR